MTRGGSNFFLSQRVGRWRWPWLVLSLPAGLFVTVVVMAAFLVPAESEALAGTWFAEVADQMNDLDAVATTPSLVAAELLMVGITFWIPAVVGSLIHGRSIRSLVEPVRAFSWSVTGKVLTLQSLLTLVAFGLSFIAPFDRPEFTGIGQRHLIWLVPIAVATFVQTSGEDVFFKGYLLRQLGAATRVFWFAPAAVTLIFVALHIGNPDLQDQLWLVLPVFVASELMVIYLTMRTGGLEVALCWHWFNNIVIILLIAERATQANELTLFIYDEDSTTNRDDAVSTAIYFILFLGLQLIAFIWPRSPFFLERHHYLPWAEDPAASPGPKSPTTVGL